MVSLWALVNPAAATEEREFIVLGTGHEVELAATGTFIGTVITFDGEFVWHVYERYVQFHPEVSI